MPVYVGVAGNYYMADAPKNVSDSRIVAPSRALVDLLAGVAEVNGDNKGVPIQIAQDAVSEDSPNWTGLPNHSGAVDV